MDSFSLILTYINIYNNIYNKGIGGSMRKFIPVIFIFLLAFAGCSFLTPSPDFTIVDTGTYIGWYAAPDVTYLFDEINIRNNTDIDCRITEVRYDYLHEGNNLISLPNEPMTFDVLLAANNTKLETVGTATLLEVPFFFPQSVYDRMVAEDWDNVTLRVYITVEDDYGYGKTTEKYIDVAIIM